MLGSDLFPKNFIYALSAPSNYCGSEKYFSNNGPQVKYITDEDSEIFSMNHKKDWYGRRLFDSFYYAINSFFLANAIMDIRNPEKNKNRSMLINMSRFVNVQHEIKKIVEEYYESIKISISQTHRLSAEEASLKDTFDKEYSSSLNETETPSWEEVFGCLYEAIKNIKIIVVNSSRNSEKLDYNKAGDEGIRVIAVGGLALSRGLTLEGLIVSYFYRNTTTFDVLMQMGRWFGYRDGYFDICRIFITKQSASYYNEIQEDIDCLKKDIKEMCDQHKKPKDYGIRVRNISEDLNITAANKMRTAESKIERKSYYGSVFETPYMSCDTEIIKSNIQVSFDFLSKIKKEQRDISVSHPYFRNIKKEYVIDLLAALKIHKANSNFDTKQILEFLNKCDSELETFDVLVMGGSSKNKFEFDPLGININLIERKFDIHENAEEKILRMSGARTRLGGRTDTQYGLTDELRKQISEEPKTTQSDFLVKGRNPLIIIYYVALKIDEDDESRFGSEVKPTVYGVLLEKLRLENINYVVGFSIGFPRIDGEIEPSTTYMVNKTLNYFDFDHDDNYNGDDGNE